MNPDLNQVLGTDEELFKHAFLQKHLTKIGDIIVIAIEPYDRDLHHKDMRELLKKIRKRFPDLCKRFLVKYVEVVDYVFIGTYSTMLYEKE
jgi:hypothetical protein